MADADIAYRIAEERIAKARAEDLPFLSLSPESYKAHGMTWAAEELLAALTALPPGIANLTALRTLDLANTQVADVAPLASLTALQRVWLSDTPVADIAPLANLTALREIGLDNTLITKIPHLARLLALTTLSLANTRVTDISPLSGLLELHALDLTNTPIKSLLPLANLYTLQDLNLHNSIAYLSPLTDFGSAWETDDLDLSFLAFHGNPAIGIGGILEGLYDEDLTDPERTAKALARLREARDRRPKPPEPALEPAPDRPFVFLSYSRADTEKAAALRAALEADGVTVWQDVEIRAGARFRDEIAQRLDAAAAVLVLWSEASVGSDFVISEAERARAAEKIVPAMVESCAVPAPFDVFNTVEVKFGKQVSGRVTPTGQTSDGPARLIVNTSDHAYQTLLWSLRALFPDAPGAPPAKAPEDAPVVAADDGRMRSDYAPMVDDDEDQAQMQRDLRRRLTALERIVRPVNWAGDIADDADRFAGLLNRPAPSIPPKGVWTLWNNLKDEAELQQIRAARANAANDDFERETLSAQLLPEEARVALDGVVRICGP